MSNVIQQIWKKDGNREKGSFTDASGEYGDKISDMTQPFATVKEARECIPGLIADYEFIYGKGDTPDYEVVQTLTGMRISGKAKREP